MLQESGGSGGAIEGISAQLSPRELDLVDFVCLGYTNKEIARKFIGNFQHFGAVEYDRVQVRVLQQPSNAVNAAATADKAAINTASPIN